MVDSFFGLTPCPSPVGRGDPPQPLPKEGDPPQPSLLREGEKDSVKIWRE